MNIELKMNIEQKELTKGPIDLCWRAGAAQEIKEPTQPPLSSSVSQAQED